MGLNETVHVCLNVFPCWRTYEKLCTIWYHLYNLKNVKNTHEGVILLTKLQAEAFIFTKSNTLPWVFFTIFKL